MQLLHCRLLSLHPRRPSSGGQGRWGTGARPSTRESRGAAAEAAARAWM